MITITNGRVTLSVTPGAYREVYAPQGFTEVTTRATETPQIEPQAQGNNLPEVTPEDTTEDNSDASEDKFETNTPEHVADTDEDLSEIPLGEMNSEQLKAYAKQLGVDLRGLNSKRAVRDKIRAAL